MLCVIENYGNSYLNAPPPRNRCDFAFVSQDVLMFIAGVIKSGRLRM
jgi:hypothetical protein